LTNWFRLHGVHAAHVVMAAGVHSVAVYSPVVQVGQSIQSVSVISEHSRAAYFPEVHEVHAVHCCSSVALHRLLTYSFAAHDVHQLSHVSPALATAAKTKKAVAASILIWPRRSP
jgi:hypothetical protein